MQKAKTMWLEKQCRIQSSSVSYIAIYSMHALPALLLHIVREVITSHDQNFADWQCRLPACNRNRTVMNPEVRA